MARSTKTQKALNLNAAHGLLSRGSGMAEAATRHLAAASVSVSARGACARTCDAGSRTVSASDVQDSRRRARAIACVFQAQRFAAKRDCHRGDREAFDRNTSARKTWLSALQSVLRFVWNLRSIVCSPSSYNKSTDYWLRTAFVQ